MGDLREMSFGRWLTFFDAVLAGLAFLLDLACDTLDALIVVVLGSVALL